jgi:hypothetical protein
MVPTLLFALLLACTTGASGAADARGTPASVAAAGKPAAAGAAKPARPVRSPSQTARQRMSPPPWVVNPPPPGQKPIHSLPLQIYIDVPKVPQKLVGPSKPIDGE